MRKILTSIVIAIGFWPGVTLALDDASIPVKVPTYWGTSAPGGNITCPMPIPSQISITAGRGSWTDGFPPLTFLPAGAGGVPPFGQDMNGVLCQISQWTRWYNAGGPIPYDNTFQSAIGGYPKGSTVRSVLTPGVSFLSTANNNASDPDAGGANWRPIISSPPLIPTMYVTPVSGTPVVSTDQVAVTQLFYTPKEGGIITWWSGKAFTSVNTFYVSGIDSNGALTLNLVSQHLASTLYDLFIIDDGAGNPVMVTGPAWQTSTPGSSSRGASAAIVRSSNSFGFYMNAGIQTMRNGSTTYSVCSGCGLYVGTVLIDASAGHVTVTPAIGQNRRWPIFNMFQRARLEVVVADPALEWHVTTAPSAWQVSNNGNLNNNMIIVVGVPEERLYIDFIQTIGTPLNPPVFAEAEITIGVNSTNTACGYEGTMGIPSGTTMNNSLLTRCRVLPANAVGATQIYPLEAIESGSGTALFFGLGIKNMDLSARWNG